MKHDLRMTLTAALISIVMSGPLYAAGGSGLAYPGSTEETLRDESEAIVEILKEAVAQDAGNPDAWHDLARAYLDLRTVNGRAKAEVALTRAMRMSPGVVEFKMTLADLLWDRGMYHDAEAKYRQVLAESPESAHAAYRIGNRAAKELRKFSAMGNGYLTGGGQTFAGFVEKDRAKAIQYLSKAIETEPGFAEPYYALGQVYWDSGEPRGLLEASQMLLKYRPSDRNALLFSGLASQAIGDERSAAKYYEAALLQMTESDREILETVDLVASKEDKLAIERSLIVQGGDSNMDWWEGPGFTSFWRSQDPLYLTESNERRMDHYGRLAYANLYFSVPEHRIDGWATDPGRTVIKFGIPSQRIGAHHGFTEDWYYGGTHIRFWGDGYGRWSFDVGLSSGGGLYASLGRALEQPPFNSIWSPSGAGYMYNNIHLLHFVRAEELTRLRLLPIIISPREIFDDTPPKYDDPYREVKYPLPRQVALFSEGDAARAELAYAIPKEKMAIDDDGLMRLEQGTFVFGEQWNEVVSDVKDVFDLPPAGKDSLRSAYLVDHRQITLERGRYHFVVEALDPRTGKIGTFREERSAAYSDTALTVSDLLLASRIDLLNPEPRSRADVDIVPNPLRTYGREETVKLYLEVYNLEKNAFGRVAYDMTYDVGWPESADEVDPLLFPSAEDLEPVESRGYRFVEVMRPPETYSERQGAEDWMSGTERIVEHRVQYARPKKTKKTVELLPDQVWETSVTARYEGDSEDAVTALSIDVREMPAGIHKLAVSVQDLVSGDVVDRVTYFRLLE